MSAQRPAISRDVPERQKRDRMRQVNADLTLACVRSVLGNYMHHSRANVIVRHPSPDARPARPIARSRRLSTSDRTGRSSQASVRSIFCVLGQTTPSPINDWTHRGESGHPVASVRSWTISSFSFSKSTTASPLLPIC
jgi:hypothetical protein